METSSASILLIGYACGIGAGNTLCSEGPILMKASPYMAKIPHRWVAMLTPKDKQQKLGALESIIDISQRLAEKTNKLSTENEFFITIGGDHTCAIGTWSGVSSAITPKKLGLLWIDAHLDSHTLETTPSGNIHGMPLAALLGEGDPSLVDISHLSPKLHPDSVCVLGVRSYEPEEQHLLEQLGVRIYYMDEILSRGFNTIFKEAVSIISGSCDYFGVSLDLDAINPDQAPGVGTPEKKGICLESVYQAFDMIVKNDKFIAGEIAEFNPSLDKNHQTEQIIAHLVEQMLERKKRG